jgi:hypothetical protein
VDERVSSLTKRKEFEIRMRYEYGENLTDLAVIYKVALSTLRKRVKASQNKGDPWIKGSRINHAYKEYVGKSEAEKKLIKEKINNYARAEMELLQERVDETYSTGKLLDDDVEFAVNKRLSRVNKMLVLRRNIEDIPSTLDELLQEKLKVEIELKKIELDNAKVELETKKEELELYRSVNK